MSIDAHVRHVKKSSRGRSSATKKKTGSGRESNARLSEIMRLIRTGKLHVTSEEMKKLRKLRGEIRHVNRVYNLHQPARRARQVQRSNRAERFVVDSGATITLLRSKKWLRQLLTRVRAIVKTATGESVKTKAHGPLQVWSRNRKGENVSLGRVGEGMGA